MSVPVVSVEKHFSTRDSQVKYIFDELLLAIRPFGPIKIEPKKTSIHLVRRTAFAGILTRKSSLILTVKSDSDIPSPRVFKRDQVSPNRWHVEMKLDAPESIDKELIEWLRRAYDLSA